jgi:hypothetical protein
LLLIGLKERPGDLGGSATAVEACIVLFETSCWYSYRLPAINSSKASLHSTENSNTHSINSGVRKFRFQIHSLQKDSAAEKMEYSHHHTCFLKDDHRISKQKFRNLLVLMRMAKRKSPYLPKHDFFLQGFLSTGRTIE